MVVWNSVLKVIDLFTGGKDSAFDITLLRSNSMMSKSAVPTLKERFKFRCRLLSHAELRVQIPLGASILKR